MKSAAGSTVPEDSRVGSMQSQAGGCWRAGLQTAAVMENVGEGERGALSSFSQAFSRAAGLRFKLLQEKEHADFPAPRQLPGLQQDSSCRCRQRCASRERTLPSRRGTAAGWRGSGLAGIGSGRGSGGAAPKPALRTGSGGSRGLWPRSRSEGRCCRVGPSPCSHLPPQGRSGETTCPGERAGRCVPARRWGSRSRGRAGRGCSGPVPQRAEPPGPRGPPGGAACPPAARAPGRGARVLCGAPSALPRSGGARGRGRGRGLPWRCAGMAVGGGGCPPGPGARSAGTGAVGSGVPSTDRCHGHRRTRRVPGPSPPYASRPPGVAVVPQEPGWGLRGPQSAAAVGQGRPEGLLPVPLTSGV